MTTLQSNTPSTTASAVTSTPTQAGIEIDPHAAKRMLAEAGTVLVDCREADEHARERIAGSKLIPLAGLTPEGIRSLGAKRVLIHCRGGRRSLDAATRCAGLASSGVEVLSITGGIEAWRKAGLGTVVDSAKPRLGVMQQTQLAIGVGVLAGTALGALVNPWFLVIPAFMGGGLVVAGATGFCGLATVLAKMPWNRVKSQCSTTSGSCCS